jgi:hypothetical protein
MLSAVGGLWLTLGPLPIGEAQLHAERRGCISRNIDVQADPLEGVSSSLG